MATDRTLAFEGLPLFNWVDAFMRWPSLVRLPFLLTLTIVLVIGPFLAGAGFRETTGLFVSIFMSGCGLAVYVILARGFQSDLVDSGHTNLAQQLIPNRHQARIGTFGALVIGVVVLCVFNHQFDEHPLQWLNLFTPDYYARVPAAEAINWWLLTITLFYSGIVTVNLVVYFGNQLRLAREWAEQIDIDLMHIERCEVCSQPVIRYLLIVVILASMNILSYEILSNVGFEEGSVNVLTPLMMFTLIGCYPVLQPLVILRDRIAEAKANEIDAIREALKGSRDALARSQIAPIADEFRAPDLMNYEQQVKAIWEWPIQGDVQRILLYVFLPPLAWVLAALVEQVVDSMM